MKCPFSILLVFISCLYNLVFYLETIGEVPPLEVPLLRSSYHHHHLIAILAGNLNSSLSYLITTVLVNFFPYLRNFPFHGLAEFL